MPNWKVNDTATLSVTVSRNGSPVTGQTPLCTLIRVSDSKFYNFTTGLFQAPAYSHPMPEPYPGHYELQFPQGVADPDKWEDYRAFYVNLGPRAFYQNELHSFRSAAGESLAVVAVGSLGDALKAVFGALYANAVLDNTTFNTVGLLTGGRVRLFPSPALAAAATDGAADDAQGEWARFTIFAEAEATPNERLTKTFRMTRTK